MTGLKLTNDIVFFDIESTGLNIIRDRIIQLAMIKYYADGRPHEERDILINPGPVLISEEAYAVHGISAEKLRNKPTFEQLAEEIFEFIGDADLAGYNSNRFDVPMLMEELARAGYDLAISDRKLVDVQRIFYLMEPRTLRAALRFYQGKDLENAHDALADVRATVDVLRGQLDKYEDGEYIDSDGNRHPSPVVRDVDALHAFTVDKSVADATRRLKYNQKGELVFNFGVNAGKPVGRTLYNDRNYMAWMLNKDFSSQVKQMIQQEFKKYQIEQEKK